MAPLEIKSPESCLPSGRVTIGIPTLNRAHYLKLAIDSALAQTYPDIEIVVSDNASKDETRELLSSLDDHRIRILEQEVRISMVDNWNACLSAATGEYFLLLSDDDLLHRDAISSLVAALDQTGESDGVGFAYCRGQIIDQEGNLVAYSKAAPATEDALSLILAFFQGRRETWPCCILLRTADMSPGYSSDFLVITDAAMWMKVVILRGRACFCDKALVSYRIHQNTSASTPIDVWQKENRGLAGFAIATLKQTGQLPEGTVQAIEDAADDLNGRIVPALINRTFQSRKLAGIAQYVQHFREVRSPRLALRYARGMVTLLLPSALRESLVRWRAAVAYRNRGS